VVTGPISGLRSGLTDRAVLGLRTPGATRTTAVRPNDGSGVLIRRLAVRHSNQPRHRPQHTSARSPSPPVTGHATNFARIISAILGALTGTPGFRGGKRQVLKGRPGTPPTPRAVLRRLPGARVETWSAARQGNAQFPADPGTGPDRDRRIVGAVLRRVCIRRVPALKNNNTRESFERFRSTLSLVPVIHFPRLPTWMRPPRRPHTSRPWATTERPPSKKLRGEPFSRRRPLKSPSGSRRTRRLMDNYRRRGHPDPPFGGLRRLQ